MNNIPVYKEYVDGHVVELLANGSLIDDGKLIEGWSLFADGRPWIPKKRKTFISNVKSYLRD